MNLSTLANLSTLYSEPHRFYHNLSHIHHCLNELEGYCRENVGLYDEDKEILTLAIWFHDAYYNTLGGSNEEISAQLCERAIIHQTGHATGIASDAILHTKNHSVDQVVHSVIACLLLDIDLAILGSDLVTYKKYLLNIEREYYFAGVSVQDYLKGRLRFLSTMQERKSLYYTTYFSNKYEASARSNLAMEIACIKDCMKLDKGYE